jgi:DNA-binding NarL/FixJ family response regulator
MIVFATNRPLRMARMEQVLRMVGLLEKPVFVAPSLLCQTLGAAGDALVLIDGRSQPSWEMMARARRGSPASRFVLCSKTVTPELVQAAMECGLDGVLSTSLAVQDAALTLQQIRQGERKFRFEPAPSPMAIKAAPAAVDFDGFWMFGAAREF